MSQDKIEILQQELAREKAARILAEKTLESKTTELLQANKKLEQSYLALEADLNKADSQLQGVFENIVDAYVIMDLMGYILKMNDAAVKLLGFDNSKEDFNLLEMVKPSEALRVAESFQKLLKNGSLTDFNVTVITKKKEEKIVHINASVIYDKGSPVAAQGIVRDITKEKEIETNLIQSEKRLVDLLKNLDSGVLVEDENRKMVLINDAFVGFFLKTGKPLMQKGDDCSLAAERNKSLFKNPEHFVKSVEQAVKNRKLIKDEEFQTVDGKIFERDFVPIFNTDNEYKGHMWNYRDVTIQRNFNRSLEFQKQKYQNIIANMNLGMVEVGIDDRILMVNQSFAKMTGYTEKELIGVKGKDFLPAKEDKDLVKEKVKARKKGRTDLYEVRIRNKAGDIRYWLVSGAPNYNVKGELVGSIGINFDITDFKNLQLQKEELLKKVEKSNNELQEYAHIVSHDLKSPLRSINALVSWLKEDNKGKLDDISMQNLALIDTTLEKMDQLISDVLSYSSIGADENEKVDVNLNEVITSLIKIMYKPDHISIDILNKLPIVKGDKTKLQQVFQNLISNAIKFIDKEKGFVKINVEDAQTHYKFSIEDNGMGIEKKFHDKIFKIFQALNKREDSTGIGLSIVKKIIDLHEGQIWLDSEPTKGTTFFFTLKK
ncbi:PAS domain-containing sensor histidine kinase [Algibacter sp. PT7-4]|uniref:PAS domain-containing sensor histidine kinase n=1 Tax=Algibacter ulvanivorans TaxID=3400999 RepID=UPI003AAC21DF